MSAYLSQSDDMYEAWRNYLDWLDEVADEEED